jgi:nitrile hydratase
MGGMHGFGPVVAEPNEPNDPIFDAEREKRAFALTLATNISARWNIDLVRFVRENRHPAEYLSEATSPSAASSRPSSSLPVSCAITL